jgi:hypothetical protein
VSGLRPVKGEGEGGVGGATHRQTEPDGGRVPDEDDHTARVETWLERSAKDLAPTDLRRLLEAALGALWTRSKTTLGEVTLTAIAERVLYTTSERFPVFSSIKVEPKTGIAFRGNDEPRPAHEPELRSGIRFVLVEFLTVLGNLTAEILTPELHAELSTVDLPSGGRPAKGPENGAPVSEKPAMARAGES